MSQKVKKEWVEDMFNHIAPTYDLSNSLFSFGIDNYWRRVLVKEIVKSEPLEILDIATGTGKLANILFLKTNAKVTGVDISENMLKIAAAKFKNIDFKIADGQNLPYEQESFNAVTIAFGIRNFENPEIGLQESYRVLKNNGIIAILEFSKTKRNIWGLFFNFYFKNIIPFLGKIISKHKTAYKYLNSSATAFYSGNEMIKLIEKVNFKEVKQKSLTGGIATIYIGYKKI